MSDFEREVKAPPRLYTINNKQLSLLIKKGFKNGKKRFYYRV